MGWLGIVIRFPLVVLYMLSGYIAISLLHILAGKLWYQHHWGKQVIRHWMAIFAWLIGLRLHIQGKPVNGLIVANHISWLDIIALDSVIASRFVSKDDVLHWPLVGLLPKWSGTFFLQRGSASAVSKLNTEITAGLKQGDAVIVFPEGATHDGTEIHNFYSALLQPGIDAGVSVQAVAIRYFRDGKIDTIAPFIGQDGFLTHLFKVLAVTRTDVYLHFCQPVDAGGMSRKQLSNELRDQLIDIFKAMQAG